MALVERREYNRQAMERSRRRKALGEDAVPRLKPGPLGPRPRPVKEGVGSAGDVPLNRPGKELLLEARRRKEAPFRTQVSALLGDPPYGYSALDRESVELAEKVLSRQERKITLASLEALARDLVSAGEAEYE